MKPTLYHVHDLFERHDCNYIINYENWLDADLDDPYMSDNQENSKSYVQYVKNLNVDPISEYCMLHIMSYKLACKFKELKFNYQIKKLYKRKAYYGAEYYYELDTFEDGRYLPIEKQQMFEYYESHYCTRNNTLKLSANNLLSKSDVVDYFDDENTVWATTLYNMFDWLKEVTKLDLTIIKSPIDDTKTCVYYTSKKGKRIFIRTSDGDVEVSRKNPEGVEDVVNQIINIILNYENRT